MSIFESILYGVVSGLSEFLPVSSQGQQAILLRLFGLQEREPFRDLMMHIAILTAMLLACRPMLHHLRNERRLAANRKRKAVDSKAVYEMRLVRTARVPLLVGMFFYIAGRRYEQSPVLLALFFVINGLLIIIPEYIRHGNKDARFMTGFDGIVMGVFGSLSVLPGISRVAVMNGYALARGSDRQQAVNWILQLSIPALIVFAIIDITALFSAGFGISSFVDFIGILLSALTAFAGGYFSVVIVRNLSVKTGFSGFAYYSWGLALFSFILYLVA